MEVLIAIGIAASLVGGGIYLVIKSKAKPKTKGAAGRPTHSDQERK